MGEASKQLDGTGSPGYALGKQRRMIAVPETVGCRGNNTMNFLRAEGGACGALDLPSGVVCLWSVGPFAKGLAADSLSYCVA